MRHIVFTALAVGALLLGGLVAPSHAGDIRFGRVWAGDKVLREGCNYYRYQYVVRPRTNNWALETFLREPSGQILTSGGFHFGADPKRGHGRFRICNDTTRPGRFKISGKLTWKSCDILGHCTKHVRWVKAGYFRMRRA